MRILSLEFGPEYISYDHCYDCHEWCHDHYRVVIRCYGPALIPPSKFGAYSQSSSVFTFFHYDTVGFVILSYSKVLAGDFGIEEQSNIL